MKIEGAAPVRAGAVGLALAALLSAPGCSGMSEIDRKVARIVDEQSGSLGLDAPPAALRSLTTTERVPEQARERPRTVNPDALGLSYVGADAARDVLARLDRYATWPSEGRQVDLAGALRSAQTTGREFLDAEEQYILAAISLLIERHRWSPRFFDTLSASVAGAPGDEYTTALNLINELRATQRLPYGGEVEARLVTSAVRQLSNIVGEEYTQSSQLVLSAEVPLLRNAGLIAREDLIQAERNVVYAARSFEDFRRSFLVDIARDYFSLLQQMSVIRNQGERLRSVQLFYEQTRALVEAGREPPFEARNVEQNVLSSRNSLINTREAFILALDRFKVRLGIADDEPVVLVPMSLDLEDPEIDPARAAELALQYRLDYQNEVDRVDDARRRVANARNQLLPDLTFDASAALNTNTDDQVGGLSFDLDQTTSRAGLSLGLALDREIERLQLRQATIGLQADSRELDRFRDTLALEARQSVREIDRARLSVRLQEQAVEINELRLEEIRIKSDEVDAQTRLDAENELLQSRNDRDSAIRDLRIAILDYLRRTGQLRVSPDGQLRELPGMVIRSGTGAEPSADAPAPMEDAPPGAPADAPAEPPVEVPDPADAPIDAPPPVEPPPGSRGF